MIWPWRFAMVEAVKFYAGNPSSKIFGDVNSTRPLQARQIYERYRLEFAVFCAFQERQKCQSDFYIG